MAGGKVVDGLGKMQGGRQINPDSRGKLTQAGDRETRLTLHGSTPQASCPPHPFSLAF